MAKKAAVQKHLRKLRSQERAAQAKKLREDRQAHERALLQHAVRLAVDATRTAVKGDMTLSRPRNPSWFKPRHMLGGKVGPKINRKGRPKGARDKHPRALMMRCPNCGYRPTRGHRRILLKRREQRGETS